MLDGYEIPLHRSLIDPLLMAGAPRAAAIAIGTLAAALALGLRLWVPGLVVWLAGQSFAVLLARAAPDVLWRVPDQFSLSRPRP